MKYIRIDIFNTFNTPKLYFQLVYVMGTTSYHLSDGYLMKDIAAKFFKNGALIAELDNCSTDVKCFKVSR